MPLTQYTESPRYLRLHRADNVAVIVNDGGVSAGTAFGSVPGKMQLGPAWWFLDQKDGIERQLEAISQIGSLRRFVGMVADSRSFLSFTRHEYFRRILCNLLGTEMATGLLPRDFDLVGALVEDVCFRNAESFFGFELPDRDREAASASAPALHAALG